MRTAILIIVLLAAGTGLVFALGRGSAVQPAVHSQTATFAGATMGTSYSVKVAGLPPTADQARIAAEIQARLDRINSLMSTYDPDSELSRFNASESDNWFPVSRETAEVVAEAIRVGDLSGGALDVTVGPLVDLWSFGPTARPEGVVPSQEEIAAAMAGVGYSRLQVRSDGLAVRKLSPACRVDLSAVAKGFAVDQVAEGLEQLGIGRYMVEVGGEVRTSGRNARGRPWQIAVEVPTTTGRGVQRIIPLGDRALATSGDYRNYFEHDGVRFCHIINPRTGRPVNHRLASVSILASTCMEADAQATALFVLGPDEGLQLATAQKIPALFVVRTDRGFEEFPTPTFPTVKP